MTNKIVLFPTYRYAVNKWQDLIRQYPDMWTKVTKHPDMTLTSVLGIRYIFRSENEVDKLRGYHGDFISAYEIDVESKVDMRGAENE